MQYLSLSAASIVKPGVTAIEKSATPDTAASVVTVFFALLLVLGIIFACAWIIKRLNFPVLANQSPIKVIASHSLGTKERIVVVQIAEQQLLLGVTAQNISLLSSLEGDGITIEEKHETPLNQSAFAQQLTQVLGSR